MSAHRIIGSLALACTGAVVACGSNPPPSSPSGVTSAQKTDRETAVSRVTAATCKHAQACNEIGGDHKYANKDACVEQNRGNLENGLRASDCPQGVDSTRLEACVTAINAEACSGFGSGAERGMACSTGQLCP